MQKIQYNVPENVKYSMVKFAKYTIDLKILTNEAEIEFVKAISDSEHTNVKDASDYN